MLHTLVFFSILSLALSVYELNEHPIINTVMLTPDKNVIIIDNFFKNFEKVRDVEKEKLKRRIRVNYYPGHRYKLLTKPDDPYFDGKKCGFSMMTVKPGEALPMQKIPHTDGIEWRALLVYLEDRHYDGTGFYRHKGSNIIKAPVDESFQNMLDNELQYVKEKDGYISDSNERWELLLHVEMKRNRAVIYDGDLLHAPYIKKYVEGRMTFGCFEPLTKQVHWTFD